MAATSSYMSLTKFSMLGWSGRISDKRSELIIKRRSSYFSISAQQQQEAQVDEAQQEATASTVEVEEEKEERMKGGGGPRPVEPQRNVKSKNMSREYGGQWLSSATRHVRIYAAYIDPVTCEFDQTQMDKLTLILDPTNEFEWTPHTCNLVYSYFQDLVDHYEGAPLTEYTLRLIGSDVEHYIRKLLYDGEIRYNMNAKVLNFSMGKPRIGFNYDGQLRDVNQ